MKKILKILCIVMFSIMCFSEGALMVQATGNSMVIEGMKTDNLINPLGIDSEKPVFSWSLYDPATRGQKQTFYRVTVANSEENLSKGEYVWDSGKVVSDETAYINYNGKTLDASTRYFWCVYVGDKDGNTVKSGTAWFETGLMDEGWSGAKWIAKTDLDSTETVTESSPMFRKEFTTASGKTVANARLYFTSAGIYRAFINGEKVTDSYLNPGMTAYDDHIMYQTYDVTELIKNGDNAIGVYLGHGWWDKALRNFGNRLHIYGKLYIEYTDGTSEAVVTDESWKFYRFGPVIDDDIFNGFKFDGVKEAEMEGWNKPGYDDSAWESVKVSAENNIVSNGKTPVIIAQNIPLIKNTITLDAVSVTEPKDGVYVYDFGQNIAGVVRITATAPKGTTVKLRHAETLNEANMTGADDDPGMIFTANLPRAEATDTYVFNGNPDGETFEPFFTYHGFRYLEITGLDNPIPIEAVKALLIMTDLPQTSSFESSNALVNRLYLNSLWSARDNFLSVPTDCPQRGERFGWTGDAQIFARTGSYMMDVNAFYQKYCMDMRDTSTDNRIIADVSPASVGNGWFGQGDRTGATNGWGDAIIIIPYQMYKQYGNIGILEENYETMCNWMDYLVSTSTDYIRDESWTGDWLAVNEPKTPIEVTDTAFCAYSAMLLSEIAEALGKDSDAEKYSVLYNCYRDAWRENFLEDDGFTTKCGTQTSYVLGIKFKLFDEDKIPEAAKNLVENIKGWNWHLSTGFLGLSYLNPVLSDTGYSEAAFKLLEQEEYPSWLYSVTLDSTSIWESWYVIRRNSDGTKTINEESQNHFSYGAVSEWLFRYMLGIDRDDESSVAFKHFVLKPEFGGSFTYANGSYDSIRGTIQSGWTLDKETGVFTYSAVVPANTTATLYLPVKSEETAVTESGVLANESDGVTYVGYEDGHAVYELASGSYEFVTYVNPDMNNISSVKITNSQNIDATVTVSGKSFDRFPAYEIVAASEFTVDVVSNEENYAFSHFVSENGEVIEADNVFSGDMAVDMVFAYTGADDGDENTKTVTITGQDGITIEINGSKYKLPYSGVFDKGELVEIKVFVDVYAKEFSNLGCIKSAGDVIYLMPSEDITKEIELCDARYIKGYDVFFDFTDNIAHWKGSNAKLSFEPGYMRFDAVKKADGSFDPRAYYDFTESESTITGGEYVPSEMYDSLEIGFVADEVAANSTPVLYISTEDLPSFLSPVRSRKASSAITTGMADGNTLQKTEFSLSDWDNWTGNIKQVYLDLIDNVDGSIRIDYIRFKHRNFKLTVKTNPNDLGTVYEYMPGETALLAALETEEGFLGYSLDAGSKDYITEVVMSKDTIIYANYDNDDSDDDSNDENNSSVILWDFEDNTLQNWINANAQSSSVNNGVVKVTHTTSWADAYFYTSGVNAAASKYKYIVAKIRHNVPEGQKGTKPFEVFFRRTTDNWSQGLSVNTELLPASDDFKTYIFDMSENANWNGTIDYIRIDPFEAVSSADNAFYYEMDSIMLAEEAFLVLNPNYSGAETVTYGVPSDFEINPCDYLIPERDGYQFAGWTNGENSDTVTNITVTGSVQLYAKWEKSYSAYIWDFEDGLAEDWTVANSINRGVTNGVWQVEFSTATSDAWIKNESLEFPASVYKYIVIELKHNIPEGEFGTRPLEVFFVREGDTPWQQHLSVNVPQVSSAGENFNTYVIDMSECANWTNTVKRLRIDPFEKKSDTDNVYYFEIDRIAICPELTLTLDYGNGKTEYAVPAQTTIDLSLYDEPESEDMIFVGWSRSADGEIIDTVSLSENTTLYAVWSESGTSISLTDEYVNVKTEVLAVLVVSSYYDNGKMCDCIVRSVNENTKFIFEEEGLDVESASTVKAFLFDSATGMRPLCKSKEVPVIDEYANFVKLIDDNACYSEYMSAEGTSFVFPSVLGNQMVASWTNGDVVYKSGSVVDAEYVRKEEFTIKDYADVSVLNGLNIVCIGDSLTQGDYGWIPAGTANVKKEGYPYFFELFTGANVINAGRCGYSCELYYNYLPNIDENLTADTDIVIIMLGTNQGLTDTIEADTASGNADNYATTQTGYYARIVEHVAEKTEGNAQIILMTPPVTTKRDRAFLESTCEVIKKFGEKYGLAVIDNYNNCGITYDNIKTYMPIDELHCGYDGYKMLAAHVALKTAEYCNNAEDCGYLLEYAELDEDIGFIGRWYDKTVNGVECKATISQGAEMFFMVEGTKNVSLRLHSTAQKAPVIAVSVDGRAPVRMTTALTGDMTVAQNLSADKHYIRIIVDGFYEYQANKWSTGDGFAIEKVVVDDGGKVTGLEPENPVILYYGDSITEGVNVLGTGSTPDSNSAVYEFPFVTSHLLGAVSYTNGFGASGVTKGGSGGVPKCLTTIDSILENTSIDSCKNPYAIVVNHGHNDGSATSETFITEYKAVLSRLREKYPDTPIFAVVPYFQIHSANIKTAVEQMGDDRIFYISTNGWEYTTSDGVHPDRNGAEKLGTRLAEEMEKILKAEKMRPDAEDIANHVTQELWHTDEVPYHIESATNYATITPYISAGSDEAVIIYPGGGYFQLSTVNEGTVIAQAYNAKGISAFVVTYRYAPYNGNAILADGQRAVQYVRYFADDFGINPDKIAILGFSAGGHLATMVCQHEPEENLAGDAVGEESSVPNVVLLGYAVTTLGDGTYSTMPGIFLGEENKTNSSLVEKYSYTNDISKMPPAFIFYSTLDAAVNPEKNSIPLATAMENAGKTVEIHGYTDGNHGIGLGTGYEDFSKWIDDSCVFLEKING